MLNCAASRLLSRPQTILNAKSCAVAAARYGLHRDHSDLRAASNTEANLVGNGGGTNTQITQCATTGRRRKGTSSSLSGSLSNRSSAYNDTKELRSALKDREAVIQNLRIQLCLGKLPRPSGPPLNEAERPAAEQKLQKLKAEAENKKIKIRNLKSALDKLDITDNIDTRIRQAELEYALGREELQMLSIVEEAREVQARLEKSRPELQTLYTVLNAGATVSLQAVHATTGRWAAQTKPDQPGFFVEWALEGDGLYKGDRILEVNGQLVACQTKEELQKIVGNSGKCQMVVLRKKPAPIPPKQHDPPVQGKDKENSMRLQHRISYLEEQVKELQSAQGHLQQHQHHQQQQPAALQTPSSGNGHVTSISITSPPTTPPEKPLIYQRGNYITTLVGGKPIELLGADTNLNSSNNNNNNNNVVENGNCAHITKTLIKENTQIDFLRERQRDRTPHSHMPPKSLSASKISINSDSAYMQQQQHYRRCDKDQRERHHHHHRERERSAATKAGMLSQRAIMQARSVEHLNHCNGLERRREASAISGRHSDVHSGSSSSRSSRQYADMRSVKSLDFGNENEPKTPATNGNDSRVRPTPPKKPLRLSLQRAQSLQTVELHPNNPELDKKRPMKRSHHIMDDKAALALTNTLTATEITIDGTPDERLIENCAPLQTASLGRHKHSNI